MKKYFLGIGAAFLLSVSVSSAAAFTQQEIDAILELLRSFNVDPSIMSTVESSLTGQTPVVPPTGQTTPPPASTTGAGEPFTATSNLNVRSDPGSGVVVATVPAGSEGLIYGEPFYYALRTWEYVVFDAGPQGWVATEFGTKRRSSTSPFPAQCYVGTWPAPGSGGCLANADGASYTCGGVTYRKPTLSTCTISAPETVYYNEPFTINVTGGTDQSISVGEWRGPLAPSMCPTRLTNCTGSTCTLQATATQPGTLFVGFFTHKPAPGGINVYGPTCRKIIRAMVRPGGVVPPPPPSGSTTPSCTINGSSASTITKAVNETFTLPWASINADYLVSSGWSGPIQCNDGTDPRNCKDTYLTSGNVGAQAQWGNIFLETAGQASVTLTPKKNDGTTGSSCTFTVTSTSGTTPPPPPPATTPPPPAGSSCSNNWNSTNGGYYQKPGTSCPCQYFTATGGQVIGPAVPESCSPVAQTESLMTDTSGLNISPQRFGSPQTGTMVWVRADTALVTDTGVYAYTGTDFPAGSEARLSKSYNGGTLTCQSGTWMTKYGMLVEASGGNTTVFKMNGRSESDGLFVWWRGSDGSYDWRRMTIDEYRAENRIYDLPGWGNVPYAPNCVAGGFNIQDLPLPHYFKVGDRIEVDRMKVGSSNLNIRSGPAGTTLGSQAPLVGQQPAGMQGCILAGKANSGGTWYNIDFNSGVDGWASLGFIKKVGSCSTAQLGIPSSVAITSTDTGPALANTLQGLRETLLGLQAALSQ
ncbi:MAG: SH3 domain-containing protein [Patescibacteria group bacterium]